MKTVTMFLSAMSLMLVASSTWAQRNPSYAEEPQARRVATESLATLRSLVTSANAQGMGFRSPEEVSTAALKEPLTVYFVRLDTLRQYHAGQDPAEVLSGGEKLFFPVAVGGDVRSSLVVEKSGGSWRTVSFGNPELAKALSRARDQIAASPGSPAFAVHVASLSLYFIGRRDGAQLLLATVTADPRLKMTPGVPRPAQEVFAELVPLAQQYNGLPR